MSEQTVELHRRAIGAFNARDIEALIALSDPDIELHSTFAAVGGAVYQGHDGLRRWHRDLQEAWGDEIRLEPEAYFDLGEHTVVFQIMRARGKQSGAEVAMPNAGVARWRGGLMTYYKVYVHREDTLLDLASQKDALEPIAP